MAQSQLVKKLKQGDSQAVRRWFDQYYSDLMRIAVKKAKNKKDAEDLVQETFINCLKNIHVFRGSSSLKTWMISILRHEIADYYRKKYAKKAIKTLPLSDFILSRQIEDSSQVSRKVKTVLSKMLSRRKKLLLMKYVDGLQVEEIAQKVGRTFKAVESDLYRARESFKELYLALERVEGS